MKKVWLWLLKVGMLLAIGGVTVWYFFLRKDRQAPPMNEPEKPEVIEPTDFLGALTKKKEKIDEKISNMSKRDLVDSVNADYD